MSVYDDNKDLWDGESTEEEPEPELQVDPYDQNFRLMPVQRGVTGQLQDVWEICQKFGGMIIGGYARYMVSDAEDIALPKDIDVFVVSFPGEIEEDWLKRYNKLHEAFELMTDACKEGPLSSYFFYSEPNDEQLSINLVRPRIDADHMVTTGSLYEIMDFFDFTIARVGLISLEMASVDPDFREDERAKILRWKHINCPVAGVFRMAKYTKKGYFCPPREVIKLFIDWNARSKEYQDALIMALQNSDLTEEEILDLERLLWVD